LRVLVQAGGRAAEAMETAASEMSVTASAMMTQTGRQWTKAPVRGWGAPATKGRWMRQELDWQCGARVVAAWGRETAAARRGRGQRMRCDGG